MTPAFSGIYIDGLPERRHEVAVTLAPAGLRIEGIAGNSPQLWPYDDIRLVAQANSDRPVEISWDKANSAKLLVADPAFGPEITARLAPHAAGARAPRHTVHWTALIVAGVAVLALVIGIAVPQTAHWLAPLIPIGWEESAGKHIAEAVISTAHTTSGQAKRTCATAAGTAALGRLTDSLVEAVDSPYTFRVQVVPHPTINALAMPGGYVVIFSGLLEFAETPDEIAGVLAHEMAHIVHRHVIAAMLRELGYVLIFDLLSGGAAGGAISIGHELLTLSYSREAEAEADATGLEILKRAGIGAHGFVALWDRMRNREGKGGAVKPPALLSTHPDSDARATLARAARQTGTPALTAEEWLALRAICTG